MNMKLPTLALKDGTKTEISRPRLLINGSEGQILI